MDTSKLRNKKLFISLPMRGRSDFDIFNRMAYLYRPFFKEYELIQQYIPEDEIETDNKLYFISHSIEMMGEADLVIFDSDWMKADGCKIEYDICVLYNIPYIILAFSVNDIYYSNESYTSKNNKNLLFINKKSSSDEEHFIPSSNCDNVNTMDLMKLPVDADGVLWHGDEQHCKDRCGIQHVMNGVLFDGNEWYVNTSIGAIPVNITHHC